MELQIEHGSIGRVNQGLKEKYHVCIVFPMGMESYRFLQRLEIRSRWSAGKATYRQAFFEGRTLLVIKSGVGPARAAAALHRLDEPPAPWIICAGVAGALAPHLCVGDVVISRETCFDAAPNITETCDPSLINEMAEVCRRAALRHSIVKSVTVGQAVFERNERQALFDRTAAASVDMETHSLALEAQRLGAAYGSVRVISDDMNTLLPPAPRNIIELCRRPLTLHRTLPAYLARRSFHKKLRCAVDMLPDILVQLVRRLSVGA